MFTIRWLEMKPLAVNFLVDLWPVHYGLSLKNNWFSSKLFFWFDILHFCGCIQRLFYQLITISQNPRSCSINSLKFKKIPFTCYKTKKTANILILQTGTSQCFHVCSERKDINLLIDYQKMWLICCQSNSWLMGSTLALFIYSP